jgi:hypothetical protein
MKYYFGIYVEYTNPHRPRIAQVTTTIDDLSCEMLADPGVITFYYSERRRCREHGKHLALIHNCQFIEFGWGKYQLIKIKKDKK